MTTLDELIQNNTPKQQLIGFSLSQVFIDIVKDNKHPELFKGDFFNDEKIDTKNIKCIFAGTRVTKQNLDEFVEGSGSRYWLNYNELTVFKRFINDLLNENKLYQPRLQNEITKEYDPIAYNYQNKGLFDMEEFEQNVLPSMLEHGAYLGYIESFQQSNLEQFANKSALEIMEQYSKVEINDIMKTEIEEFDGQNDKLKSFDEIGDRA